MYTSTYSSEHLAQKPILNLNSNWKQWANSQSVDVSLLIPTEFLIRCSTFVNLTLENAGNLEYCVMADIFS